MNILIIIVWLGSGFAGWLLLLWDINRDGMVDELEADDFLVVIPCLLLGPLLLTPLLVHEMYRYVFK